MNDQPPEPKQPQAAIAWARQYPVASKAEMTARDRLNALPAGRVVAVVLREADGTERTVRIT